MKIIQQVTQNPNQTQTLILDDGTRVTFNLYFRPMQYGWFFESIVYKEFTLRGCRVVTSPNILQQYKNLLPFGIACYTKDNQEPTQRQDFASGYAKLYLMSAAEVVQLTEYISGKVQS